MLVTRVVLRHDAFEVFCIHGLGSLSLWERAGGEGRCAPCDCVGRAAQFNGPLPCAHTVAPKGPRGSRGKAPHPNPLPAGRAKTLSADTVAAEGTKGGLTHA